MVIDFATQRTLVVTRFMIAFLLLSWQASVDELEVEHGLFIGFGLVFPEHFQIAIRHFEAILPGLLNPLQVCWQRGSLSDVGSKVVSDCLALYV